MKHVLCVRIVISTEHSTLLSLHNDLLRKALIRSQVRAVGPEATEITSLAQGHTVPGGGLALELCQSGSSP
jgi:hypothetical protein